MDEEQTFAVVGWRVGDVLTLRPDMNYGDAENFLEQNGKYIQEVMVERGWSAIEELLAYEDDDPDNNVDFEGD